LEGKRESRSGLDHFNHNAISVGDSKVLRALLKSTGCQFHRDGDFMVCQICGWRMRITDPSLPPEKYHAPCGGADSQRGNQRSSFDH
jgi:hypothetical protein